jgi:hypothetical protein
MGPPVLQRARSCVCVEEGTPLDLDLVSCASACRPVGARPPAHGGRPEPSLPPPRTRLDPRARPYHIPSPSCPLHPACAGGIGVVGAPPSWIWAWSPVGARSPPRWPVLQRARSCVCVCVCGGGHPPGPDRPAPLVRCGPVVCGACGVGVWRATQWGEWKLTLPSPAALVLAVALWGRHLSWSWPGTV